MGQRPPAKAGWPFCILERAVHDGVDIGPYSMDAPQRPASPIEIVSIMYVDGAARQTSGGPAEMIKARTALRAEDHRDVAARKVCGPFDRSPVVTRTKGA